jgi:NAD(P)-dependent dehydrogenase (short-subunit alcohol dehydrogenase family)
MQTYGRLDYALLNAGIGERGDVVWSRDGSWQPTLDIDLRAVVEGVGLASRAMLTGNPDGDQPAPGSSSSGRAGTSGGGGVIMITASAGGVYPMPLRCVASLPGCTERH